MIFLIILPTRLEYYNHLLNFNKTILPNIKVTMEITQSGRFNLLDLMITYYQNKHEFTIFLNLYHMFISKLMVFLTLINITVHNTNIIDKLISRILYELVIAQDSCFVKESPFNYNMITYLPLNHENIKWKATISTYRLKLSIR